MNSTSFARKFASGLFTQFIPFEYTEGYRTRTPYDIFIPSFFTRHYKKIIFKDILYMSCSVFIGVHGYFVLRYLGYVVNAKWCKQKETFFMVTSLYYKNRNSSLLYAINKESNCFVIFQLP